MHAAGQDRAWLYAHATDQLKEVWWIHYGRYLHQRTQGKPTQYITGHQEFYGREFRVTPDVLIPRPETEHLIDAALSKTKPGDRVLDVGTGSGILAVTLALELQARQQKTPETKASKIVACDISLPTLRIAQENASHLGANVPFIECDLSTAFASASFDVVVSNPPYVPLRDRTGLQKEVRGFEPAQALFAGEDGNDVYRRLIPEAARVLKPGGWLVMELGDAEAVRAMLTDWDRVEAVNDLAGVPRVISAQKTSTIV